MAYIIKVTIEDTHPPVWRRLLVPDGISFRDLHDILQIAFGWEDEHLHNFTFPNRYIQITQDGGSGYGDYVEESDAVIDDFIEVCKWIRYTYDFGDDWRHKIVLEKVDEAYHGRCAAVLKAKGDNFAEDSGGIWRAEEEEREPFYLEEVNGRLGKREFSGKKSKKSALCLARLLKESEREKSSRKEKYFDEYQELMKQPEISSFYKTSSERFQRILQVMEYGESEIFRQNTETFTISIHFHEPVKTRKDMLLELSKEELRDYGKWLQVELEEKTEEQCAETIAGIFEEHPEYLLYIFSKEEFVLLKKLLTIPYRRSYEIKWGEINALLKGMTVCILDAELSETAGNKSVRIRFASDLAALMEKITAAETEKFYQEHTTIFKNLTSLLLTYSVLEIKKIGELYAEIFGQNVKEEELQRCILLHMCFAKGALFIAGEGTGNDFLAMEELNVEEVMAAMEKYEVTVPYKRIQKKQLLSPDMGFAERYPIWQEFYTFIVENFEVSEEEMCYLSSRTFLSVQNGEPIAEIQQEIEQEFEFSGVILRTELWNLLSNVSLNTPLSFLKGYSREEYSKLTGTKPWELGLYDRISERDTPEKRGLYSILPERQYELYGIMKRKKNSPSDIRAVKKILMETAAEIPELKYILTLVCLREEKLDEAEALFKELYRETGDDDMKKAVRMIKESKQQAGFSSAWSNSFDWNGDSEWDKPMGEVIPFRREKEKIGRNAPCPCGSGKKFKQCCMGKGIYD